MALSPAESEKFNKILSDGQTARNQLRDKIQSGEVQGDVALVLSSLVDHKNETAWADRMRAKGVRRSCAIASPAVRLDCTKRSIRANIPFGAASFPVREQFEWNATVSARPCASVRPKATPLARGSSCGVRSPER